MKFIFLRLSVGLRDFSVRLRWSSVRVQHLPSILQKKITLYRFGFTGDRISMIFKAINAYRSGLLLNIDIPTQITMHTSIDEHLNII